MPIANLSPSIEVTMIKLLLTATLFFIFGCTKQGDQSNHHPSGLLGLQPLTISERTTDFNFLINSIKENYVFLQYKQKKFHFNFDELVTKSREKLPLIKNDTEFFSLITELLAHLRDAHIQTSQPLDEMVVKIPIHVESVEGKVFIEKVTDKSLEAAADIRVGDEVLEVDGKPVMSYLPKILKYINYGNDITNSHLIWFLFNTPDYMTELLPTSSSVKLKLQSPEGMVYERTLPWRKERIELGRTAYAPDSSTSGTIQKKFERAGFLPLSGLPEPFFINQKTIDTFQISEVTPSPQTLKKFSVTNSNLKIFSGLYKYNNKTILIFRIPNYGGELSEVIEKINYYKALLFDFGRLADVIVIDQTHNNGGMNGFAEKFIALFAQQNTRNAVIFPKANRYWLEFLASASGNLKDNKIKSTYFELAYKNIEEAMSKGQLISQVPFAVAAYDYAVPYPDIQNTKPILMLIDEQSGSYGDAVPQVFKENKLATLFGERTLGAGGNRLDFTMPISQIKFSLVNSIIDVYKPDGKYDFENLIENNGVKPDIHYSHTLQDAQQGYLNFVKSFSEAASKLAN